MKVFSAYQDGRLTIFLQGELDHHEIKNSVAVIESLIEQYIPRSCILDLRSLSFMDSSGIALILRPADLSVLALMLIFVITFPAYHSPYLLSSFFGPSV